MNVKDMAKLTSAKQFRLCLFDLYSLHANRIQIIEQTSFYNWKLLLLSQRPFPGMCECLFCSDTH